MDNATKLQLDSLVGATIHYEKQNIIIKKYKEIGGNICIVTNLRTFQFYPNEIQEKFIDKISDAKEEGTFIPPTEIEKQTFIALPNENLTIKEMLLDSLKKVKEDPNYIPQAKTICEITNTLVNVQKAELDFIKTQKGI